MYRDQRRRELRQVLGALAACGAMVGLVGGCGTDRPAEKLLGSQAFQAGEAATATCPSVANLLPDDLPSRLISGIARNLGLIEIQVAAANQRLAKRTDAADLGAAQNAVLGTLETQRTVLIRDITTILGTAGDKPEGLDEAAACTLAGAADPVQPIDTSAPYDTSEPAASAAPADSAAPSDAVVPTDGAVPTDSGAPADSSAPADSAAPIAVPFKAGKSAAASATPKATKAAKPAKTTKTADPKGPVKIVTSTKPSVKKPAAPKGSAAPEAIPAASDTAAPEDTAAPADTATAAPADSAAPSDGATPDPSGSGAIVTDLAVVCPPVAEALTEIPRVIKSEVARNLGLLELQIASVNHQLLDKAGDDSFQEALLAALHKKRGAVIERIADRVYRATGTPPTLDALTECAFNDAAAPPDGTATDAPADPSATPSPADTATDAPSDTPSPAESASNDSSSSGTY
ncbi:hypothetical protein [Sphaerisporangium corydalis]|uniref:Uncharacterized protein n=1 Tax=Sphaerisporangium corydalis TaxID=1441875 RepID=A0ABV9E6G7_9ACTN|nr:hypothetical protein [Sphaerisporangium corydalis]